MQYSEAHSCPVVQSHENVNSVLRHYMYAIFAQLNSFIICITLCNICADLLYTLLIVTLIVHYAE